MMSKEIRVSPIGRIEQVIDIQTTASDDWHAALVLHGELDAASAPRLRAELERHLDEGRRVIRIDVGGVTFIDSTAIGELVAASKRCRRDFGSLILTNVPPSVQKIVKITGLDAVLLIDTAGGA